MQSCRGVLIACSHAQISLGVLLSAKLFLPSENRKQRLVRTMLCLKHIFIGDAGDANKVFEIVDVGEFEVCCL